MPLYTGDYIRDTQHLSCSEHGIFLKLLMHCWDQKGPAPLDERKLCGIVNARSSDEIEAMRRVLGEFFVRMEDGHYNKRMQREIERSESISGARSAAGKLGASKRAKQLPNKCSANAKQVYLPPPPPPPLSLQPQPPSTNTHTGPVGPRRSVDDRFDRFWSAYPKKVGKDAARKAFERRRTDDDLVDVMVDAVKAQKASQQWMKDGGQYIPNPATWLTQGRWQDDAASLDGGRNAGIPAFAKGASIEAHNNEVARRILERMEREEREAKQ